MVGWYELQRTWEAQPLWPWQPQLTSAVSLGVPHYLHLQFPVYHLYYSLSCCCNKIPRPKATCKGRFFVYLILGRGEITRCIPSSWGQVKHNQDRSRKLLPGFLPAPRSSATFLILDSTGLSSQGSWHHLQIVFPFPSCVMLTTKLTIIWLKQTCSHICMYLSFWWCFPRLWPHEFLFLMLLSLMWPKSCIFLLDSLITSCISLSDATFPDSNHITYWWIPRTTFELRGKPYDSTSPAFQIRATWEIAQAYICWSYVYICCLNYGYKAYWVHRQTKENSSRDEILWIVWDRILF